jgi:hypothetical protein
MVASYSTSAFSLHPNPSRSTAYTLYFLASSGMLYLTEFRQRQSVHRTNTHVTLVFLTSYDVFPPHKPDR